MQVEVHERAPALGEITPEAEGADGSPAESFASLEQVSLSPCVCVCISLTFYLSLSLFPPLAVRLSLLLPVRVCVSRPLSITEPFSMRTPFKSFDVFPVRILSKNVLNTV